MDSDTTAWLAAQLKRLLNRKLNVLTVDKSDLDLTDQAKLLIG